MLAIYSESFEVAHSDTCRFLAVRGLHKEVAYCFFGSLFSSLVLQRKIICRPKQGNIALKHLDNIKSALYQRR